MTPLDFTCTYCLAKPGEECWVPEGGKIDFGRFHSSRKWAWTRFEEGEMKAIEQLRDRLRLEQTYEGEA